MLLVVGRNGRCETSICEQFFLCFFFLLQPGCGRTVPRFVVHLRVMYFPPNISMLAMRESRHLHYEQVFYDIVSGVTCIKKDEALLLAGLALQAEYGDYGGQVDYFKPIHYLPRKVSWPRLSTSSCYCSTDFKRDDE